MLTMTHMTFYMHSTNGQRWLTPLRLITSHFSHAHITAPVNRKSTSPNPTEPVSSSLLSWHVSHQQTKKKVAQHSMAACLCLGATLAVSTQTDTTIRDGWKSHFREIRITSKIHLLMIWPLHKLLFICLYNIFFKSHVTFMSLLMVWHYFEAVDPTVPENCHNLLNDASLWACDKSATLISQKLTSIFSSAIFKIEPQPN